MDALELQAALVKLDPATTVTPIGSNVKMLPPPPPPHHRHHHHHRITFTADLDVNDLTVESAVQNDAKSNTIVSTTLQTSRKHCSVQLTVPRRQNNDPNNPQIEVSRCEMAEVR
ncbi:PREDICTED: uncharacterized protein LOC108578654 [Habropoda laboriosa]|nr:PREDICTED: uncharacterized protein LOC108578654 [Habropoda laboriosa]